MVGRRLKAQRRSGHSDGWLVRRALLVYSPPADDLPTRLMRTLHERPYRTAFLVQVIALAIGMTLFAAAAGWLACLAPADPGGKLDVLWQVHGVFVSLAFAGLAILFQLGSESLVTGRSLRSALFRQTLFKFTFAFSVFSLVQLGIVTVWLPDDSTLILEFGVTVMALGLVAYAYAQAASVFEDPEKGERLGAAQLQEALARSQRQDWATGHANALLESTVPELISPPPSDPRLRRIDMVMDEGVITDLNEAMLRAVVGDLSSMASSVDAKFQPPQDQALGVVPSPALRLRGRIGARSGPERPIFELHQAGVPEKRLSEIEARLRACVELGREH